jgi:hypothetical protein
MPTPLDWDVDDPHSLDDVYHELDKQRVAFGMDPLKDPAKEREASLEWRSEQEGDYNRSIYVAVDLGKKADHTAVTIIEPFLPRFQSPDSVIFGHRAFIYKISRIRRYDLETPYPVIARTLKKINNQLIQDDKLDYIYFVLDEGGVGAGVSDQVCELIPHADVYRVTLTGGKSAKWNDSRNLSLPKPQMSSTLIALFEADRIWIPKGEHHAEDLKQELLNYEHKVSQAGHDQYGSIKTGTFDDIVSALGIGIWVAEDSGGGAIPLFW